MPRGSGIAPLDVRGIFFGHGNLLQYKAEARECWCGKWGYWCYIWFSDVSATAERGGGVGTLGVGERMGIRCGSCDINCASRGDKRNWGRKRFDGLDSGEDSTSWSRNGKSTSCTVDCMQKSI